MTTASDAAVRFSSSVVQIVVLCVMLEIPKAVASARSITTFKGFTYREHAQAAQDSDVSYLRPDNHTGMDEDIDGMARELSSGQPPFYVTALFRLAVGMSVVLGLGLF